MKRVSNAFYLPSNQTGQETACYELCTQKKESKKPASPLLQQAALRDLHTP